MAISRREALVMLAEVPLIKHTAMSRFRNVAAPRDWVDWRMSSAMGTPVTDARRVGRSVRQNSVTRMKMKPLRVYIVSIVPWLGRSMKR